MSFDAKIEMRASLFTVLLLHIALSSFSQTISSNEQIIYQVLENNPESANTNFIAPEFGLESNSTDLGLFLGANVRKDFSNFTLEAVGRLDIYSLNSTNSTFLLEGGLFLPLKTKEVLKEVPIFLSYNPYAGTAYHNGQTYHIEQAKYIKIPNGKFKNLYGIRGGLHYRTIGIDGEIEGVGIGNMNLGGIYIGGQMTSQAFVKTIINNDVERIGAGLNRIYGDILLLPLSNLSNDELIEVTKSDGIFGWRIGYQFYVSAHEGDYKFFGNSIFGAELGNRPLGGFMFNVYWAYALNRS